MKDFIADKEIEYTRQDKKYLEKLSNIPVINRGKLQEYIIC